MTQAKTILTVARDIRPELATLLNPEIAQQVDLKLQTLLIQAESGQVVELQIIDLLNTHQLTREWMQRYLNSETSAEITRSMQLAGDGRPIPYPRFKCPDCDYIWSQLEPSDPIPSCENNSNHGILQRL